MTANLAQDLHQAVRGARHAPGFATVVVLTFAIGIGANATIFSLLDAVMFKPLNVPAADELHVLYEQAPGAGDVDLNGGTSRWTRFSFWSFARLRQTAGDQAQLAAMTRSTRFDVRDTAGQQSGAAEVQLVSGNYFDVFRASPALGRLLNDEDNRQVDGHNVAVLSYASWQQRFGGDASIVGRTITVNHVPFIVVGVANEGFAGDRLERPVSVWIPLMMQHAVRYASNVGSYGEVRENEPWVPQERISWLYLVLRVPGRLEPTSARLDQAYRRDLLHYAGGVTDREFAAALLQRRLGIASFETGFSSLRLTYGLRLTVLMGLVALLLLVACANVANLMLARAAARRREIGIRLALGAGRRRLVAHVLIETLLLSSAGAAAGAFAANWGAALLAGQVLDTSVLPAAFGVDGRVVAFCAALALVTSILVGIVPALRATRAEPASIIGTRGVPGGSARGMAPLVVAQIAGSLLLVVTSVWFGRSLINLSRTEPGFAHEQLVSAFVNTRNSGYAPEELPALYARVGSRLAGLPGVEAVAFAECTLLTGCTSTTDLRIEGHPSEQAAIPMNRNRVMPGYFETVGMRIVGGRSFDEADVDRPVAIVNQAFAERYFGGVDPVGKRIGSDRPDTEIVGVVADARVTTLAAAAVPMYYLPLRAPAYAFSLDVRVRSNPASFVMPIERTLSAEPTLVFDGVTTMNDRIGRGMFRETLVAYLTAAFCGITVLLALLGLYGLLSYGMARRRPEIGLRMALGAQRHDVVGLVLRDAARLLTAGALLGTLGTIAARQLTEPLLLDVEPADPFTVAIAAAVLAFSAAAASYLPARRALAVDPVIALKTE